MESVMSSINVLGSRYARIGDVLHFALSIAYALNPIRIHKVFWIALLALRDRWGYRIVTNNSWNQSPIDAAGGLVLLSSDLRVETVIAAYSRGIFPQCHIGPMKWWSPPRRMMLQPCSLKIEKDVRRLLKGRHFDISFDRDFRGVMEACAAPRAGKLGLTWISSVMIDAFVRLHHAGYAHSVEVYENGQLVGGLYGVAIGRVFFTESQFSFRRNASKAALAALNAHLLAWGFIYNDGKVYSSHLERCGFELKQRGDLEEALRLAPPAGLSANWKYSHDLILEQFNRLAQSSEADVHCPVRTRYAGLPSAPSQSSTGSSIMPVG
jgi:leucyl/phenylalanyl-tRNA--protein transferase